MREQTDGVFMLRSAFLALVLMDKWNTFMMYIMVSKHKYLSIFTRSLRRDRKHLCKRYSINWSTRTFQTCFVILHTSAYLKVYLSVTNLPDERNVFLLQSELDFNSVQYMSKLQRTCSRIYSNLFTSPCWSIIPPKTNNLNPKWQSHTYHHTTPLQKIKINY